LTSKCKALSLNPSIARKKEEKKALISTFFVLDKYMVISFLRQYSCPSICAE
jgi:hypothetical protein